MTPEVLVIVRALAAIAVLVLLWILVAQGWRRSAELAGRIAAQEDELLALRGRLDALSEMDANARQRQAELERHLALLAEQQDQLMIRDADTGPYLQAIRAARSGTAANELVRTYGLSEGEANLVVTLHGRGSAGRAEGCRT